MKSEQDKEQTKQPYEKPKLRTIELVAEEVLGIGCKMAGGGPNYGLSTNCGLSMTCATDAS